MMNRKNPFQNFQNSEISCGIFQPTWHDQHLSDPRGTPCRSAAPWSSWPPRFLKPITFLFILLCSYFYIYIYSCFVSCYYLVHFIFVEFWTFFFCMPCFFSFFLILKATWPSSVTGGFVIPFQGQSRLKKWTKLLWSSMEFFKDILKFWMTFLGFILIHMIIYDSLNPDVEGQLLQKSRFQFLVSKRFWKMCWFKIPLEKNIQTGHRVCIRTNAHVVLGLWAWTLGGSRSYKRVSTFWTNCIDSIYMYIFFFHKITFKHLLQSTAPQWISFFQFTFGLNMRQLFGVQALLRREVFGVLGVLWCRICGCCGAMLGGFCFGFCKGAAWALFWLLEGRCRKVLGASFPYRQDATLCCKLTN